ncbi:chorismate binding enzyme [Musa troglodytarum]|uniref:Chorismate binding enzyme n=1 Tax=Musa troglodytarum TaxID=320322 RepID=A0A9E7KSP7_9LILI|nr:chorismate binding enzyme [Musa troglodytarum]
MAAALARSSGRLMIPNATSSSAQHRYRSCWLSMNGCGGAGGSDKAVGVCETRTLASVSAPELAVPQLKLAVSALEANPPRSGSGIIRLQVPIRQRADALQWLQAQSQHQVLPRCFFSSRGQSLDLTSLSLVGNGGGLASTAKDDGDEQELVSVAGVGSAVFFQGSYPFALQDWQSVKRFLCKECPLIRAYGAMRFDARTVVAPEWEDFGSFYFIVPQVEFDQLQESSMLALTIAWDNNLLWTWQKAMDELKATLQQISSCFGRLRKLDPKTTIISFQHFPSKGSWDISVKRALEIINGRESELVKPEQLFHRKCFHVTSEALAGTRARGVTKAEDLQIGQDLLFSPKDNIEFVIIICDEVHIEPSKALRKLPRIQHLSAQLSGRLRDEDSEFDILTSLHPSPAVCGLPTEEAQMFDRGMYAGPVGWFGGRESEFAVGIRSALVKNGVSILVFAGAGIVEGTIPSLEWEELELKESQFTKLFQYQNPMCFWIEWLCKYSFIYNKQA